MPPEGPETIESSDLGNKYRATAAEVVHNLQREMPYRASRLRGVGIGASFMTQAINSAERAGA